MSMPVGFWGLEVASGNTYSQVVETTFRLTNVALDPSSKSSNRVSLVVQVANNEFVVANILPGKVEQQVVDLVFTEGEEIVFVVKGDGVLHLTGNHMLDFDGDEDEGDDEDDEDDDEEPIGFDEDGNPIWMGDDDGDEDEEDDDEGDDDDEEADEDDIIAAINGNIKRKLVNDSGKPLKKAKIEEVMEEEEEQEKPSLKKAAPKAEPKQEEKMTKSQKKQAKKEAEASKPAPVSAKGEEPKGAKTLPSGLSIEDVVVGSGARAKNGKTVMVRYIGRLASGKVFDSNTSGGKPFTFKLGGGEVIKGWDLGVQNMNVGGTRKLVIPANLGYGSRGAPPDIPPNSVLHFEIKLIGMK